MKIRWLVLISFSLILGCSSLLRKEGPLTRSLTPPSPAEIEQNPEQKNVIWWSSFKKGEDLRHQKKPKEACLQFRQLLTSPDFPLFELVVLRAHETCESSESLPHLQALSPSARGWFAADFIAARKAHFELLPPEEKIQLLWDEARLEKQERPRELLFQKALQLAEEAGTENLRKQALARLWKNSPRLNPEPADSELNAVVRDLRRWREFSKAVALERNRLKSPKLSQEERFRILKNIRETHKVAQQREEMLKVTAEILNVSKARVRTQKKSTAAAQQWAEAAALYARTVWTENRRDLATRALHEARRHLQGRVSLEEIYFILARMSEEARKLNEAASYLKKGLAEPISTPGLRAKMAWSQGWLYYKSGDRAEAAKVLGELANESTDPVEKSKALFWKARALPAGEEKSQTLLQTQAQDPLGFYGLMATRDLGEKLLPLRPTKDHQDSFLWEGTEWSSRSAIVAEWLISLQLHDGLKTVLGDLRSELQQKGITAPESWLRLATGYARGGEYLPLFALLNSLPPETRDQLIRERPELLFPKPWLTEVQQASEKLKVPMELIYSIMRQESAFDPLARSPAEAYGLMQLLPNIAKKLAHRFHLQFDGPESLYEPAVIIPLGAAELRTLFDRWRGKWIPSVASYNAAEKAVRGWLRMRHREDPVEFIEEIPYEETRAYVKLVLRNQVFYQRLLADEPTSFPEGTLRL